MKTITFVYDALKWAFQIFSNNLLLFMKLFFISGVITIVTAVLSLGLALIVVPFYLTMCHIKIALKLYDGQTVTSLKEFFIDWRTFAKGLVALLLYSLLVNAGLVLFIIPGLYIASRYYYIIYAIVSDDAGIMESFSASERLTASLPWHGLLLLLCATALGGSLIFLGVAALMNVYAYKQCKKAQISQS